MCKVETKQTTEFLHSKKQKFDRRSRQEKRLNPKKNKILLLQTFWLQGLNDKTSTEIYALITNDSFTLDLASWLHIPSTV